MKNTVKCKSCGHENALFRLNCELCNNYLRARVWNINLWHNIRLLIESPSKAFQDIIWSEHKNFILFIVMITSIKFMVDSFYLNMIVGNTGFLIKSLFKNYILIIVELTALLFFFVFSVFYVNKLFLIETRKKDILAITTYSFIPSIFALLFLFTVELILFGGYLFSVNPLPTLIKPVLAYFLISLEILVIIWSVFLLYSGFYILTGLKLYSFFLSMFFYILLLIILYFTPYNFF